MQLHRHKLDKETNLLPSHYLQNTREGYYHIEEKPAVHLTERFHSPCIYWFPRTDKLSIIPTWNCYEQMQYNKTFILRSEKLRSLRAFVISSRVITVMYSMPGM